MTTPTVAVFGCGHWGKNLARNFAELGALTAVVDPNPETAAKHANMHGVVAMTAEEALASDVDGIVIAAPAELHADLALKGYAAGKHVYVEKPLALSVADGEKIHAAAKSADRILMVGHLLQYHPVFAALRDRVRAGDLGKLRYAYSNRLSTGKFRVEEDAFWSLAPHDVSMLLALFDEAPSEVRLSGQDFITPGIADESRLDMSFPSGGRAHVFASWLHPFKEQRLVVVGEDAMAVFDDVKPWEEKLTLYRHVIDTSGPVPIPHKAEPEFIAVPQGEPLKSECQHFLDCIADGDTPFTDGEEALRVLRVLASAQLPKAI
jgi:UDP-2-acetamido-3-amino-2,3-dideoxy-glucuronate N-acetyltransferase